MLVPAVLTAEGPYPARTNKSCQVGDYYTVYHCHMEMTNSITISESLQPLFSCKACRGHKLWFCLVAEFTIPIAYLHKKLRVFAFYKEIITMSSPRWQSGLRRGRRQIGHKCMSLYAPACAHKLFSQLADLKKEAY